MWAKGPVLSGCKNSVFRNQKSRSKTDKRKNLFFQSHRTCSRHAGHFSKSTTFYKINSRRQEKLEGYVGSHITYVCTPVDRAYALLYVCTSPAVQCLLLVPQGPSGEHVIPASCAPVAAAVSCCLTSRRQQARSRFAGTQLAEVLVSCSQRGYLLVRRRVGHLPRHATTVVLARVFSCVSRERWRYQCCDWMFGTLGGAQRMNFE